MRGIRIDFNGTLPVLDLENIQEGRKLDNQNNVVNFLTIPGSDYIYKDRGTELAKPGAMVLGIDTIAAQHECNFAALDVKQFNDAIELEASEYRDKVETPRLYVKVNKLERGVAYLSLSDSELTTIFPVNVIR